MDNTEMRTINIRNGYVQYPWNWIVLSTLGEAEECNHVGVVHAHTTVQTPYFMFFSKIPIRQLSQEEIQAILFACEEVYPAFYSIREIDLLGDVSRIGVYEILSKGEQTSYPCDAMIVRT